MKRSIKFRINREAGSVLLEGLFAILIFSIGVLAIVGLQASSMKQAVEGKYRVDASMLANELLSQMQTSNRAGTTLQTNFSSPNGAVYTTWLQRVQQELPGADNNPPTVAVDSATGDVAITVFWKAPSDTSSNSHHKYVVNTRIK